MFYLVRIGSDNVAAGPKPSEFSQLSISDGAIMHRFRIWGTSCVPFILAATAYGHGYLGDRFFPPTMTTDDPFAVDELALPTISFNQDSDVRETDYSFEFDKEIFPHFAMGISDTYIAQRGRGGEPSTYGWDNLELTAKYELWRSEKHEATVSIGLEVEVGGTGSKSVSDSFSTFSPTLYFGKGFGDLPDSLNALKPFAVTGTLAQSFPTESEAANQFQWGFAVEYSLPYLHQHVKDIGLPEPFRNMIPLVEFALSTDENGESRGITTGTVNPGVLWETPHYQLGAEALIPLNSDSGQHVGVEIQLWIFIDDLAPQLFGHPLFGGS